MHRLACVALLSLLIGVSIDAGATSEKLTLDLYLEMEDVGDPRLSPDGKRVVYSRRWIDKIDDRRQSTLWIASVDGSDAYVLARGSSAEWSPDGKKIAYLAGGSVGGTQIYVRNTDSIGATIEITRVEQAPANLAWSPDGKWIAFTMLVPRKSNNAWNIRLPARPKGAKWVSDPRIVERLVFQRDRMGYLEDGHYHVFLIQADGGTPRQLTTGEESFGGGPGFAGNLSWTPDGKEILFSSFRVDDWEYPWKSGEIFAVNVESGNKRQLTRREGPDHNPEVSPDGKWVAYTGYDWTYDSYIPSQLYVAKIDGQDSRSISASLDASLYSSPYGSPAKSFWWAADSSGVYFNISERGTRNLYFSTLDGEVKRVTSGNHILNVSDIKGNLVAATLRTPHQPGDVVVFDVRNPTFRQVTAVNEDVLRGIQLGEVQELWADSVDDFRVQGWIITPPDYDPREKYPMILAIHGGPHAMYGVGFDFAWQNHAAEGYVVLYTNPRGSTGYGAEFANAINYAYPGKDFDDLMALVDAAVAKGYVDERNLFVYGCSGGGVLTAWIVGHTDRFAAASANCPVTNWISMVGITDGASFYWNFRKNFWEDPSEHLARSPIMYVGNVKTPTMLMTGELDLNTPMSQSEEFFRALKIRNVPTALVRFPDEYHGTTSRPSNFLRTQLYLRHWFQKHSRSD